MYEPFQEPRNDVAAVALSASEKRQLRALAEHRRSSVSSVIHSFIQRELSPTEMRLCLAAALGDPPKVEAMSLIPAPKPVKRLRRKPLASPPRERRH